MNQEQLELINRAREALDALAGESPIRVSVVLGDALRAERHKLIIEILRQAPGGVLSEDVLCSALAALGHAVAGDTLRSDLAALGEQGRLACDPVAKGRVLIVRTRSPEPAVDAAFAAVFNELFGGAK